MTAEESAIKTIGKIPLSNNMIQRRISDLSENIQENIFLKLCMRDMFALQIDKNTDITNKPTILVSVRLICEFQLYEEFLFPCLLIQTTGENILNTVD